MRVNPSHWHRTLLIVSGVLGVAILTCAFVYGWFKPAGTIGDSTKVVADRSTATVYAVVGHRLYPALNLVSAQLIAGSADRPVFVSSWEIAKFPHGPAVGILGAPPEIPAVTTPQVSRWAVCDTAPARVGLPPVVTGIDGELAPADDLAGDGLLMSRGEQTYLVTGGHRIPLPDRAALGIANDAEVVPMSRALFDAIPAGKDLPKSVRLVGQGARPVTCVSWKWNANERKATLTVLSCRGLPLTTAQREHLVTVVGGGPDSVQADQVLISSGASSFVATTGAPADPGERESMWLVTPSGSRYGVPFDDPSLQALGLHRGQARPVPWSMLQVWPAGPELSRAAALTQHSPADVAVLLVKPKGTD